jgi:hypothetical protein
MSVRLVIKFDFQGQGVQHSIPQKPPQIPQIKTYKQESLLGIISNRNTVSPKLPYPNRR